MKKQGILILIPYLLFGFETYLSSLQNTLKTQTQTNLNLVKILFDQRDDDEVSVLSTYAYTKETHYSNHQGSFSVFSKNSGDSILLPYFNYTYSDLRENQDKLSSHSISAGLKSVVDADLFSILGGVSVGGNFENSSSLALDYSYLFVTAQLGVGKKFDFFDDRFIITPITYIDYGYIHQKSFKALPKTQNIHALDLLIGSQFDFRLFKSDDSVLILSWYGFYKHTFLGEMLKLQGINTSNARNRGFDFGYAGIGINWEFKKILLGIDFGSEFTNETYTLQGLAKIGMEF